MEIKVSVVPTNQNETHFNIILPQFSDYPIDRNQFRVELASNLVRGYFLGGSTYAFNGDKTLTIDLEVSLSGVSREDVVSYISSTIVKVLEEYINDD